MKRWIKGGLAVALICSSLVITAVGFYGFTKSEGDKLFEVSKNLDIFATLFRELNVYYVDDIQPGELIKAGIDGMLKKLDPYTNYIPESDIEDYRFMTTGQYGGIGALIRRRGDYVMISEPYEGYPASKVGLIPGDLIIEVDGVPVKGKTTSEMSDILKGQPGTTVQLGIKRETEDSLLVKTLKREEVKINDVPYYGHLPNHMGYIKLTRFTETASREVKEAYQTLNQKDSLHGLVLDLRGNGGGLLREAVNIVNLFVDKGQEVVHTKGKVKDWVRSHKALNEPIARTVPLIVLIDQGSASASEIVAGALQDLDRAIIIGQKSFGKGLVQQTKMLSYNAQLKLTVAKYYIPSGRCIQRIDYFNKDDSGNSFDIPDSAVTAFKTKSGRPVFDGAGIAPDLTVEPIDLSKIAISLISKLHIFDFANHYKSNHDSIVSAKAFRLSDEEYGQFQTFMDGKDYDYVTESEAILKELKQAAEKDKYYASIEKSYQGLEQEIKKNKSTDLITFKEEIKQIIENEIVGRYYYQKGRIESSLENDHDIKEALSVLGDVDRYGTILQPPSKEGSSK